MHKIQHIAITFDDGSVGIMQFVLDPRLPSDTELPGYDAKTKKRKASNEAIQHEIDKSVWAPRTVKSWSKIKASAVPKDRTFRNAWKHSAGKIVVDIDKAKEIHKGVLRQERTPLLEELDAKFMQAVEKGNAASSSIIQSIFEAKQKLRDVTIHPKLKAARTPEALKKLTVANLTEEKV